MRYACHGIERLMSRCHSPCLSHSRHRSPGASASAHGLPFHTGTRSCLCNPSGKRHASRVLSLPVSHRPRSHPRIAPTALDVQPFLLRCPPNTARRQGTPLPSSRRQRTVRYTSNTTPISMPSRPSQLALRWVLKIMYSSAASVTRALCTFSVFLRTRELRPHTSMQWPVCLRIDDADVVPLQRFRARHSHDERDCGDGPLRGWSRAVLCGDVGVCQCEHLRRYG